MKITDCKHLPEKFVGPKGSKCEECDATFNLRVCLVCGHVGCCDSDPGQHAKKHAEASGHQIIASYPAGKDDFIWCCKDDDYLKPDKNHNLIQ